MYGRLKLILLLAGLFLILAGGQAYAEEKVFTPDELAKYDGKNGAKMYVAINGVVYDITNCAGWSEGIHSFCQECIAGRDITEVMKSAPGYHNSERFMDMFTVVGKLVAASPSPSPAAASPAPVTAAETATPVEAAGGGAPGSSGGSQPANNTDKSPTPSPDTPATSSSSPATPDGGDKPVSSDSVEPAKTADSSSASPAPEGGAAEGAKQAAAGTPAEAKGSSAGTIILAAIAAVLLGAVGFYLYRRNSGKK